MYLRDKRANLQNLLLEQLKAKGYLNVKNLRELWVLKVMFEGVDPINLALDLSQDHELWAYVYLAEQGSDDEGIENLLDPTSLQIARDAITSTGLNLQHLKRYMDPKHFMGDNEALMDDPSTPRSIKEELNAENVRLAQDASIWAGWVRDANDFIENTYFTRRQVTAGSLGEFTISMSLTDTDLFKLELSQCDCEFVADQRAKLQTEYIAELSRELDELFDDRSQDALAELPSRFFRAYVQDTRKKLLEILKAPAFANSTDVANSTGVANSTDVATSTDVTNSTGTANSTDAADSRELIVQAFNLFLVLRASMAYLSSLQKPSLGRIGTPPDDLHARLGQGEFGLTSRNSFTQLALSREGGASTSVPAGMRFLNMFNLELEVFKRLSQRQKEQFFQMLEEHKLALQGQNQEMSLLMNYYLDELASGDVREYLRDSTQLSKKLASLKITAENYLLARPVLTGQASDSVKALKELHIRLREYPIEPVEQLLKLEVPLLRIGEKGPGWVYLDGQHRRMLQYLLFDAYLHTTSQGFFRAVAEGGFQGSEAEGQLFTKHMRLLEKARSRLDQGAKKRFDMIFIRESGGLRLNDSFVSHAVKELLSHAQLLSGPLGRKEIKQVVRLNRSLFCLYTPLYLTGLLGRKSGKLAKKSSPRWDYVLAVLLMKHLKKNRRRAALDG